MGQRLAERVLVIGWDAADWQMIRPLMDAGQMPALAGLMRRGVWGNLATLRPILSPMLWNSIATGKTPEHHGISGFTEPAPDGSGVRPVASTSRKCKALWNILSQSNLRSNIVGWYASHPAEPIDGVMVSNQFELPTNKFNEAWPVSEGSVHPKELVAELAEFRVHPAEMMDPQIVLPFMPAAVGKDLSGNAEAEKLLSMLAQTCSIHAVATHLMMNTEWDLTAVYYEGIDRFGHEYMAYHPPKMEQVDAEKFELFRHCMTGIYRFHDMMLQALLQIAGEQTAVIVLSDHGYFNDARRPDPERAGPTEWHRPLGMVCCAGGPFRKDERMYGASILDLTPTVLDLLGLPVGGDMQGRAWVDAYAIDHQPDVVLSWEQVPGEAGQHDADLRIDPEESRQAMQQLIDLGYIAAPGDDVQKQIEDTAGHNALALAQSMVHGGRYLRAIDVLEPLLSKADFADTARRLLLHCFIAMKRVEDAKRVAGEIADSGDGSHALLLAGVAQTPEAMIKLLAEAAACSPNDAELQQRLGHAHANLTQWEDAECAFRLSLELDPENPLAYDGLARVALGRNDPHAAVEMALEAVGYAYHLPRAHFHLGQALHQLGMTDRAAEALRVCLTQAPAHRRARALLAGICRNLGLHAEADEHEMILREISERRASAEASS